MSERKHKATYARDKRKGGYMVRVAGPNSARFAGEEVPVTTKSGDEHTEKLLDMVWAGIDEKTGENVALYHFESRPKEQEKVEF